MAEKSEYDLQREERIRRNQAMLAKLQVKLPNHQPSLHCCQVLYVLLRL